MYIYIYIDELSSKKCSFFRVRVLSSLSIAVHFHLTRNCFFAKTCRTLLSSHVISFNFVVGGNFLKIQAAYRKLQLLLWPQ
jgi:hypothetical protein